MLESETMDYCQDHTKKCIETAKLTTKVDGIEERLCFVEDELFKGDTSVKTRLKGSEDGVEEIKGLILENREVVQNRMGFQFRIFLIAISACCIAFIGCMTVIWNKMSDVDKNLIRHITHPTQQSQAIGER